MNKMSAISSIPFPTLISALIKLFFHAQFTLSVLWQFHSETIPSISQFDSFWSDIKWRRGKVGNCDKNVRSGFSHPFSLFHRQAFLLSAKFPIPRYCQPGNVTIIIDCTESLNDIKQDHWFTYQFSLEITKNKFEVAVVLNSISSATFLSSWLALIWIN